MARTKDQTTTVIRHTLAKHFAKVDVRRYNSISIRVRVIDPKFRALSLVEREKCVEPLLANIPEDVKDEITLVLLLAPDEAQHSLMNAEFEHPTPSRL